MSKGVFYLLTVAFVVVVTAPAFHHWLGLVLEWVTNIG